jgi:P-type Cu+ transporter
MKIIINLEGMHCASCSSNIERVLSKIHGVKSASVNLLAKKGYIESEHDISDEEIMKQVSRVGNYKVTGIERESGKEEKMKSMEHGEHHHGEKNQNHEHSHDEPIEEKEIRSWRRKMWLAWLFTIPIAIIMLSERILGIMFFPSGVETVVLLILASPVIFILGWKTIKSGAYGFKSLYFNMDSLISLGVLIAFITGILSLFISIQDYSGVSAMIMAFFLTGKYIENKARGQASMEIKKLLELGAKTARVLRGKQELEIPISELQEGDIMIIKPGEKIPTDGIVVRGESAVDESMISGESIPKDKTKGDKVIGATINQDGILYVKATRIGKDTFLAHIIKLVEEAQGSKVPIQAMADKITRIFVPTILAISALTFFNWLIFTNASRALEVAISVLVIACPCALGLAVPTALMVSSGMGARKGILIRRGEAIQTMKEIKIIAFDKTGTITKGKPEVREIYSEVRENYLLEFAASIEKLSEHPLGKAIVNYANLKKYHSVSSFKIIRGKGVEGKIAKKDILIGNSGLMRERKISLKSVDDKLREFENRGYTVMIVSENRKILGIIGFADAIKEDSLSAISQLNILGYKTVMITGDNARTAGAIAKEVGISEVLSEVLPEEKENKIRELQKEGMVAFVGDGINDAPALKQANVGIAIGSGSDIAIEAGDIVLASGSLEGVVSAIRLSKETFSKIKQNLFWAFGYNTIAIPIAIAGLLHPVIAEIAMALSSITVVSNANLLRRKKI